MRRFFFAAAATLAIVATAATTTLASAAGATGKNYPPAPASCSGPDSGTGGFNCFPERPATIELYTAPPVFVRSVKNGKRFIGGTGNDTFHVAHLYSDTDDYYEMGYALGQLFPNEIADMFVKIEPWLVQLLEKAVPWLPAWLADLVITYGAPVAIDLVYDITKEWIPADYHREWQGIAAGANCSIKSIERVSLFAQLSKAACSIILAHEKATSTGGAMHLRALDFDPTSMVADFSALVVYHYKTKPQLANFGWIGMTDPLTAMSDVPISVGEKKWGGHSAWLGLPIGIPWQMMIRRSLELNTLADINEYLVKNCSRAKGPSPNSVSIHLGYADQKSNKVIGYEVGYNFSQSFHWNTHNPSPTHPDFENIVYWTKNDDARTMCPADMLKTQYGAIDAEWLAMYYSPNDMTGDTQVVTFDLLAMKVYYANSRKTGASGPMCAYYRTRTLLDMKQIFAEPSPSNT